MRDGQLFLLAVASYPAYEVSWVHYLVLGPADARRDPVVWECLRLETGELAYVAEGEMARHEHQGKRVEL